MGNLYESNISAPNNLRAGSSDWIVETAVVASGEGILGAGAVLGKITESGQYAYANSAGTDDGRRSGTRVLLEDIDATDADVTCTVLRMGEVNENALDFGGTDDVDNHRATLDAAGIILRNSVEA